VGGAGGEGAGWRVTVAVTTRGGEAAAAAEGKAAAAEGLIGLEGLRSERGSRDIGSGARSVAAHASEGLGAVMLAAATRGGLRRPRSTSGPGGGGCGCGGGDCGCGGGDGS